MAEGTWSDYVAEAGTDPVALDTATTDMSDAATAVDAGIDAIDTTGMPEQVTDALGDASYNATEAASWADWSQGGLEDAAEWQDTAADHLQSAQEWAEYGNLDAAQEEIAAAQTASDIADGVVDQASVDASIGAEYMDSSVDSLGDAAASSVDTSSYDASSSYDTSSADVSSDV